MWGDSVQWSENNTSSWNLECPLSTRLNMARINLLTDITFKCHWQKYNRNINSDPYKMRPKQINCLFPVSLHYLHYQWKKNSDLCNVHVWFLCWLFRWWLICKAYDNMANMLMYKGIMNWDCKQPDFLCLCSIQAVKL